VETTSTVISPRDAYRYVRDGDGAASSEDALSWSVCEDPSSGHVRMKFPRYVSTEIAVAATNEIARVLLERRMPAIIVADLAEVESFDVGAPIASVRAALPARVLIERVDIIARRRIVRLAAVSAAKVLGLPITLRSPPRAR
jgi:hypothetical protein